MIFLRLCIHRRPYKLYEIRYLRPRPYIGPCLCCIMLYIGPRVCSPTQPQHGPVDLSVLEEVLELVHPTRLVLIRGQPLSLIDKIYCLYIHKHGPM